MSTHPEPVLFSSAYATHSLSMRMVFVWRSLDEVLSAKRMPVLAVRLFSGFSSPFLGNFRLWDVVLAFPIVVALSPTSQANMVSVRSPVEVFSTQWMPVFAVRLSNFWMFAKVFFRTEKNKVLRITASWNLASVMEVASRWFWAFEKFVDKMVGKPTLAVKSDTPVTSWSF